MISLNSQLNLAGYEGAYIFIHSLICGSTQIWSFTTISSHFHNTSDNKITNNLFFSSSFFWSFCKLRGSRMRVGDGHTSSVRTIGWRWCVVKFPQNPRVDSNGAQQLVWNLLPWRWQNVKFIPLDWHTNINKKWNNYLNYPNSFRFNLVLLSPANPLTLETNDGKRKKKRSET